MVDAGVLAALAVAGATAGFVDAIAGGGGMITLPALLVAGLPPHLALGTNKGQSFWGSGSALVRYARSPLLDRRRALVGIAPALLGSVCGVALVALVPPRVLTPLVMGLLLAVAVFLLVRRPPAQPRPHVARGPALAVAVAFVLAAYDGFFGPGTGTFLIVAYAGLWGDPFDAASANAKLVNFCSNVGAMVTFAAKGFIVWPMALAMGAGQVVGAWAGAHVAIRRGHAFVRTVVVLVSVAGVLRLAWQLAH